MRIFLFLLVCAPLAFCYYPDLFHPKLEFEDVTPTRGQPWPLPQSYISKTTYFNIQPETFKFILISKCDILVNAVKRYKNLTFIDGCSDSPSKKGKKNRKPLRKDRFQIGTLNNLTIKVLSDCEEYPYLNMDELYRLKINDPDMPNEAVLLSSTVWGALRGLETFSQLVYQPQAGKFAINTTSIMDFPRFSFRGMLLDTSRHFVSMPVIYQNLDAMAQSKLNVFHWHIVDDNSFPYVSKKFPDLSNEGAFNPKTHIYSQADVADVIEYARLRGIRVLAEFDSPGHTLSWGKSQPSLLTACYEKGQPISGKFGPIDPTNEDVYGFLTALFREISEVFPDDYLHLGGDEVDFTCWESNPNIQKFMEDHGFGTNFSRLEEYYMQQVVDIVKSYNKSYIVWQEVFDNGVKLDPDTVIHVWKGGQESELSNVTKAGFKTILSSCWYLNEITYGVDWQKYYDCDPQEFFGSDDQKKLVIGGEACMWGEFVDSANLISRTWPRASVVAERLWSHKSVTSSKEAAPRLGEFRCKLLKRGLKVESINGPGYCDCDYLLS